MRALTIVFLVGFLLTAFSCTVPSSRMIQKMIQRLFPYLDYQALRDTLWESEDKRVRVKFNSQAKSANLFYQGQQYDFVSYDYDEGVFTMAIAQRRNNSSAWKKLILRPETKTYAYFDLISDGKKLGGTLNQIK